MINLLALGGLSPMELIIIVAVIVLLFGSSKIPLREMVTIDYLYVANWTLWGDVKILCRTVPYMLARRGL